MKRLKTHGKNIVFFLCVVVLNVLLYRIVSGSIKEQFYLKVNTAIHNADGDEYLLLYYSYGDDFSGDKSVKSYEKTKDGNAFLIDLEETDTEKIRSVRIDYRVEAAKTASLSSIELQLCGVTVSRILLTDDIWYQASYSDIVYLGENELQIQTGDPFIIFGDDMAAFVSGSYEKCYAAVCRFTIVICSVLLILELVYRRFFIGFMNMVFLKAWDVSPADGELKQKEGKRKWVLFCMLIVLLQCLNILYWTKQKKTYFVDELYTYKSVANLYSREEPVIHWYAGETENAYGTHDDFMDYITAGEGESILEQSPDKVIRSVLTDNTYEVLMSILLFWFQGIFTKRVSAGLNIVIFCFVQYVFYKIVMQVFNERRIAALLMGIYGISFGAVETAIYIRHYILYLLLSLLYTLCILKMIEKDSIRKREVFVTLLLLWFGYLNCEYMLIHAGLFAVMFLAVCIFDKNWIKLKNFLGCYGIGALVFFGMKFDWFRSAAEGTGDGQLVWAIDKIVNIDAERIGQSVGDYFRLLWEYTGSTSIFWVSVSILVTALIIKGRVVYSLKKRRLYIVLLAGCLGYTVCVGWVAPWLAWRYIANVYPLFLIIFSVFLIAPDCRNITKYAAVMLCLAAGFGNICMNGPSMDVLNSGVSPALIHRVQEAVGDRDIIYMETGDRVSLFYFGFMWPSGTDVFITSPATFRSNRFRAVRTLSQDTVTVWVDAEDRWENEVRKLMEDCGYQDFVCMYSFKGGNTVAPFVIYQCSREQL